MHGGSDRQYAFRLKFSAKEGQKANEAKSEAVENWKLRLEESP